MARARRFALLAVLAGCAHAGPGSSASLEPPAVPEEQRVDGRVLVQFDPDGDRYLASPYPGPLPDRATLAALAVGEVARDEAVRFFGAFFRDGVDPKTIDAPPRGYRAVVMPRAWNQTTAYQELRREGFRPRVAVSLEVSVSLLDAEGKPVWRRSYDSGILEGPAYFPRGAGGERLGRAAHGAIARLLQRAAEETAAEARRGAPPR